MHGRYTHLKYIYDDLSAAWFRLRGYQTCTISKPGMCDVVCWHPKQRIFALCEVKSPNERDASLTYETGYNVQGLARSEILKHIRHAPGYAGNAGLWKLYAFTLSSQLYSYYKRVDEHIRTAGKSEKGLQGIARQRVRVTAYLSAPAENEWIVRRITRYFRKQGWIKNARHYRNEALIVTAVHYDMEG